MIDTKDPDGPALEFSRAAWSAFTEWAATLAA